MSLIRVAAKKMSAHCGAAESPHHRRPHPLRRGPGVDKRRRDGPVPEGGLHHEDVPRAIVDPERERVAQAVRRVPRADPGLREPGIEAPLRVPRGQRLVVPAGDRRAAAPIADSCTLQLGELGPQV